MESYTVVAVLLFLFLLPLLLLDDYYYCRLAAVTTIVRASDVNVMHLSLSFSLLLLHYPPMTITTKDATAVPFYLTIARTVGILKHVGRGGQPKIQTEVVRDTCLNPYVLAPDIYFQPSSPPAFQPSSLPSLPALQPSSPAQARKAGGLEGWRAGRLGGLEAGRLEGWDAGGDCGAGASRG